MHRQRPFLLVGGAVACLALTACGASKVTIHSAELTGADADLCRSMIDALPNSVGDQLRRPVDPEDAYGAAYGDPAIVIRCGVPRPPALDGVIQCQTINDIDWFVPDDEFADDDADVVATTVSSRPYVEMRVPARYRPLDAEFVDVSAAIGDTLKREKPCTN